MIAIKKRIYILYCLFRITKVAMAVPVCEKIRTKGLGRIGQTEVFAKVGAN